MATRTNKRKTLSESDSSELGSNSSKEGEKTIPFLRRLVDMLKENDEVISFYPGVNKDGQRLLGKIVVHDRARVESEILPRYFSHSSFASLRRQLNYFSFTRLGKGRQRGAAYCNDAVIDLDDILHLKRRPVGSTAGLAEHNQNFVQLSNEFSDRGTKDTERGLVAKHAESPGETASKLWQHSSIRNAVVPFVHLPPSSQQMPKLAANKTTHGNKKLRLSKLDTPSIISPLSASPAHSSDEDEAQSSSRPRKIILDLTVDIPTLSNGARRGNQGHFQMQNRTEANPSWYDDDDILEGCNALLSFSSGCSRPMTLA